jgi:hypothetical protein
MERPEILHATMPDVANPEPPRRWTLHPAVTVPVVVALVTVACGAPPPTPPQEQVVAWKNLGEWSGRGNSQTESFIGLTGALRMHWQTKNEAPHGAGTFRLILQSAISGRDLHETVDAAGPGEGTAYVAEDPRAFQISVESANLDWSFTVEEAIFGSAVERAKQSN